MSELESFPGSFPRRHSLRGPSSVSANSCLFSSLSGRAKIDLLGYLKIQSPFVVWFFQKEETGNLIDPWELWCPGEGAAALGQACAVLKPLFIGYLSFFQLS